jgi:hypothetical protein
MVMNFFNPQPKNPPVRLYGRAKTEFKKRLYKKAGGRCQGKDCGKPLYMTGNLFTDFAHLAHIISYGAGGGDTEDNCKIKCYDCHIIVEHGPRWSKDGL